MNNVEHHRLICEALNSLYERKNHDYGDAFHDTFVEEGFAMSRIRLTDKLKRFKTLSKQVEQGYTDSLIVKNQQVQDESIRDTLIDMANYAIMTVMEIDRINKEFERPQDKEHDTDKEMSSCDQYY